MAMVGRVMMGLGFLLLLLLFLFCLLHVSPTRTVYLRHGYA